MSTKITLFSPLLLSSLYYSFWLGKMCWRPKKKKKQIVRGAAKLLWWHFHFFFSCFFLFPIEFLLLYTQEIRWLSISGVANSHSTQSYSHTHRHTEDVLNRWVNGILNGRPIGVFLTIEKHLWVIIILLLLLLPRCRHFYSGFLHFLLLACFVVAHAA